MTLEEIGGWPAILGAIAGGSDLPAEHTAAAMASVLAGEATPAQIAALGIGLRMKGETVEEITGLLSAMLAVADRVSLDPGIVAIDTCGTGGDRSGTINISTAAALVAAGAGARVCKHGGAAATSQAGSADVLRALGVVVDLGPDGVATCVHELGMGFCFAPRYHPAWRHVGPVRRELGVPTVFNFLGPLANPARVQRQVLGISDPRMAEKLIGVLAANGTTHALIVYSHDGLDELSTTGKSTAVELRDGSIREAVVDPAGLGLAAGTRESLRGGDADANADRVRRILDGERGPQRDIVLLNAAAALVVAGLADDIEQGLGLAEAAIDDGPAAEVLERLVARSQALSAD